MRCSIKASFQIPPFRTMKSALMSFGELKKVVCHYPQNILSLIKIKKSLEVI